MITMRLSIVLAAALCTPAAAMAGLAPAALRCEYQVNPAGIDEAAPRLTWRVESKERGAQQSAYQILVASSADLLARNTGDLWDSGKVTSDATVNIPYAGQSLTSRQQCYWKVRVWDNNDDAKWSQPASWTMGLLKEGDWRADYISFRDTSPVWKDKDNLFPRLDCRHWA